MLLSVILNKKSLSKLTDKLIFITSNILSDKNLDSDTRNCSSERKKLFEFSSSKIYSC